MGDGMRLALAIGMLFLAMVAFFFAFHPQGVQGVTNPATALQWLETQFTATASGSSSASAVADTASPGGQTQAFLNGNS